MALKFMYITNQPEVAMVAQRAGVERIWIDLEKIGKQERQGHINSVKSDHNIDDIGKMKPYLTTSQLLVRINPMNENTNSDIDKVVEQGADLIMLPMFKEKKEAESFIEFVHGRAKTVLLFETKESIENLEDIMLLKGIDEVHIGLNDLHLSYRMKFMFELLANGLVEKLCKKFQKYQIPYGFGGIARVGEGLLPAERIIAEHYKLGSTRAILSRSFCDMRIEDDLEGFKLSFFSGTESIREFENSLYTKDEIFFDKNKEEIVKIVNELCHKKG